MKTSRILIIIALMAVAFFAGAAWKGADTTEQRVNDPQTDQQFVAVSDVRETAPPKELLPLESATINLFKGTAPSVVYITTLNLRSNSWSRNVLEIPSGSGSGFVWNDQGYIVTNFHVIRGGQKYQVTLADQSTWDAKVVGVAESKDLAVLWIDAPKNKLKPLALGSSDDLLVGQNVYAIGNPFGLDQTLTTGVISALGREITSLNRIPIRDVIQTDAAINPGNSGGPLLDSSGRLIGVNTQIYSPSGASAGIGFSIPVDAVKWVVPDLIEYGQINRPIIGVTLATANITREFGVPGALVLDVDPDGPAGAAGLEPTRRNRLGQIDYGDIILGVNKETVKSNNDLILALEKYQSGDQIELRILRDKKEITVPVRLGSSQN